MEENKKNATVIIIVAVLALLVGAFLSWMFLPDTTQELLKQRAEERAKWEEEAKQWAHKVDSLTTLAEKIQKKADSTVNVAETKLDAVQRELNRAYNEEIDAINNSDDYYLDVLSAPRSNKRDSLGGI